MKATVYLVEYSNGNAEYSFDPFTGNPEYGWSEKAGEIELPEGWELRVTDAGETFAYKPWSNWFSEGEGSPYVPDKNESNHRWFIRPFGSQSKEERVYVKKARA